MQYTYNYRLRLPQGGEKGKVSDLNFNSTTIDNALADNRTISVYMYDSTQTYNTGAICGYESSGHIKAYKCNTDGTTGTWDPSKWDETDLGSEIEYLSAHSTEVIPNPVDVPTAKLDTVKINGTTYVSGGDAANQNIAEDFDDTATYTVGSYCIYEDVLYRCTTAVTTAGDFDPYNWTQCVVTDELGSGGGSGLPYEEMTQEAYDLITPEHNKAYFIKDTNGDENVFQPIIYSENEREIGVWTDGKPLYQKTYISIIGSYDTSESGYVLATNITGIDNIANIKGSIRTSNGTSFSYFDLNGLGSNNGLVSDIHLNANGTLLLWSVSSTYGSAFVGGYASVTLQYTKTTDTAGSGTWTPQGVPAVHYSTNEQIIGTWVDGSTLYQKTYTVSSINASTSYVLDADTSNLNIIKIEGVFNDGALRQLPAYATISTPVVVYDYNDNLCLQNSLTSAISDVVVTIQYTKSAS